MNKKIGWLFCILLAALATYVFVSHLEKEMSLIEVVPDEALIKPMLAENFPDQLSEWEFDDTKAFFVEYRLERDRVRSQEMEMLDQLINNLQIGEEARREAEQRLLELVELMEKELTVENMLKAQGYADALLFIGKGAATVMVDTDKLTEEDFLRIIETASAITGISNEQIQVVQHD
jgi:stage III sporulation protein AH